MANNISKINPLTPMQSGMLYHSLLNETGVNYYQQMCFYLEGPLCPETLHIAWQKVIDRHEIFRTNFIWKGVKTPVQVVVEKREAEFTLVDISDLGWGSDARAEYIRHFKESDLANRFDFEKGRLNRLALVRLSATRYWVCWTFHHILLDGWSGGIVLGELFELYHCLSAGLTLPPAPRAAFSDYLDWLKRQNPAKGLEFWRNTLANFTEPTLLPADCKAPTGGATISHTALSTQQLDALKTRQLLEFCKAHNLTPNAFIQTAWGILLQKYNNTRQSCAGMTVSGRPAELPQVESIVGLFINTLPVLINRDPLTTVAELLQQVNEQLINARSYEYVSLAEIQKMFSGTEKMFDSLVVFENYPLDAVESNGGLGALGLKFELDAVFELTTYDICLEIVMGEETLFRLNYNRDTFLPETARRILNHLRLILESMLENADQRVGDLELVSADERITLIQRLNNTRAIYPKAQTIHQLFEAQVQRTPDTPAINFTGQRLTYRELNARANHLAHYLRQKGAGPDQLVGLMVERSLEMIIAVLAIMKAGSAYVPIDPEYPESRIAYMLRDSQPVILLTQEKLHQRLQKASSFIGEIIELDTFFAEASVARDLVNGASRSTWNTNLTNITRPEHLAYVIYTSGSTGEPKGVMLEHRNLVNLLSYQFTRTNARFNGRILQFNTISFDVSFQEIFTTLLAGGELYLITKELKEDLPRLFDFIQEQAIDVLYLPAALVKFIFGEEDFLQEFPRSLQHLITAGEQLIVSDNLRTYLKENQVFLHNHYGPSETHVITTLTLDPAAEIAELPSIGRPISNTQVYILNQDGHLEPQGLVGELYIGGDSVGRGYWGRADLTAERFLPNLFHPGGRMYRTGDLARWLPDGTLEFLGRADQQVKIRGFRIELGEIESRLLNYPAIKDVAVIARSTGFEKYLAAYVVSEQELPSSEIIAYLGLELPDYMIPTYFISLPELPLTPSGKVDRRALPEPENQSLGKQVIPPATPGEEKMVKIWMEILGLKQVGREDDFFALGGHSLKATQLVSRIFKEFSVEVPLKAVFANAKLWELVAFVEGGEKKTFLSIQPIEKRNYYPVSSAQKRLYFMANFEGAGITYNIPAAAIIEGQLDEQRLADTFYQLLKRHEPLRTSFAEVNGEIVQIIAEEVDFAIEFLDQSLCQGVPLEKPQGVFADLIEAFLRPFDLSRAPLLRVGLARLSPERYLFLLDIHHIVADGVSMEVLFREFTALYAGQDLPRLGIQYKDFAHWQNKMIISDAIKAAEEYWLLNLEGELPVLDLPTDYPRPAEKSFLGSRYDVLLDTELSAKVQKHAARSGVTLYIFLLAAFNVLLAKYTSQEDIIIASPIAGRRHTDVDNLLGMFVNTLAMRNHPKSNKSFAQFLAEVKENTLRAFDNQDYQFDMLVEKLNLQRDLSRSPLCDISFGLQNVNTVPLTLPNLTLTPVNFTGNIAKFDLSLAAYENEGQLHLGFEYCTSLFKPSTIERMASHFTNLLKAALENPDAELGALAMLAAEEQRQILVEFNNTAIEYPARTLHELFTEQVQRTPDTPALNVNSQLLTYRELHAESNELARVLQEKGVRPRSVVALFFEYSRPMAVAILGVLKAGGAYLPIDPATPIERIRFMLADAEVKLLLTHAAVATSDLFREIPEEIEVINLPERVDALESAVTNVIVTPADLAYIIYTSGSTGQPKGVQVEHRNVLNTVTWRRREFALDATDRVMPLFSYAFDGFVGGFFAALISGSTVVLPQSSDAKDPFQVAELLQREEVSHLICVPTFYGILLDYLETPHVFALKTVTLGGEAVNPKFIRRTRELSEHLELVNEYGPTENSVTTTCKRHLEKESQVTIGCPIANTQIYILDRTGQIVPTGVAGEVCIAGAGVARGYLNRPNLTSEKFVNNHTIARQISAISTDVSQSIESRSTDAFELASSASISAPITDPFDHLLSEPIRMYRTGDLARWLTNGEIEFLGRVDRQVKIRGYRIELDEVEQKLLLHPAVQNAAVLDCVSATGETYLSAYVVYRKPMANHDLRQALADELPEYMVPAIIIDLPELPLTATGKLNRKALPTAPLEVDIQTGVSQAPITPTEVRLANLWSEILGVTQIGRTDNFFTLGGHSLKAIALIGQIQKTFNMRLPLREIMKNPTIRQLAEYIITARKASYGTLEKNLLLLRESVQSSETSEVQHLFLIHDGSGEVSEYLTLTEHLPPTINCWGIRFDNETLSTGADLKIETIAADYLQKLKTVQPRGPYKLAGWSIGGTIVSEMVNQLEQQGETVKVAALFDTLPPEATAPNWQTTFEKENSEPRAAGELLSEDKFLTAQSSNAEIAATSNANDSRLDVRIMELLILARDRYIPGRILQTQFHYFSASGSNFDVSLWNKHCATPLVKYEIAGDHYTIFKEPAVHHLAVVLSEIIEKADNK